MTATVLMVPLVLLAMLFVVQFALAYYARTVVAGAAQDGASAAARRDGGTAEGISLADTLIDQSAGSLLDSHSVTGSTGTDTVTITASGEVVSLLPFFGTITVSASSTQPIEEFTPQGSGP